MDKKIKKLWVKALRSRKYKQGHGKLRQPGDTKKQVDRFCCLGVLCELAVKKGVIAPAQIQYSDSTYFYDGAGMVLPDKVMKWAGISAEGVFIRSNGEDDDLTRLNDNGMPFNKIANVIDKHF